MNERINEEIKKRYSDIIHGGAYQNAFNAGCQWIKDIYKDEITNYKTLVDFIKLVLLQPCSLVDGLDCMSCKAKEILEKIGEYK